MVGIVNEATLERVRPKILPGNTWEEFKHCGIPYHQLYVAINKEIPTIPIELAKKYAEKISSKPHNVLILLGEIGTGKTVLGIRYMVKCLADGFTPPIYIPNYILEGILSGQLKIVRNYHEILGYSTEFTSVHNKTAGEVISLEELGHKYRFIMIDDIREDTFWVVNSLIEQVYQSGAKLVITTNLSPEKFKENLDDRAKSRLEVLGHALQLVGDDLRKEVRK